jgi:hypothetical protein
MADSKNLRAALPPEQHTLGRLGRACRDLRQGCGTVPQKRIFAVFHAQWQEQSEYHAMLSIRTWTHLASTLSRVAKEEDRERDIGQRTPG